MLRKLYIDNMFRHHDVTFEFHKGLTGIIGPNESGKSLITEAVRYALFGSKALRGLADEYKGLHVVLDFTVAGVDYTVTRKGSRAELEGGVRASATKPVNEAIIRILGYDLTVFDVANSCNQGNVEALSNMRPAERKAMVDQTVGLNVLDHLIKFCGDEGNALKREADGLSRTLVEPEAPEAPSVDCTLEDAMSQKATAINEANEYQELKGQLASAPEKPKKPTACKVKESIDDLKTHQNQREILIQSIANTERQMKGLEFPSATEELLVEMEQAHDAYDRWKAKERLLAQGEIECPECGHSWPVAEGLEDYADVVEVPRPQLSRAEIQEQRNLEANIAKMNAFLENKKTLEEELAVTPDRSDDLEARQSWEEQDRVYRRQLAAYEEYSVGLEKKQARLEELEGAPERAAYAIDLAAEIQVYEAARTTYERAKKVFDANSKVHADLVAKSDAYLESRKGIQDLKVRIKTHLLPSLNSVASSLLNQMTGGERTLVEVDPDFEIKIDGQPLHTLSGSGKAVANLSIRLALGQILTNRVFSVFMADEIDASMDEERAAHTAEALRRLTSHVSQVIQVTHKRPETDHTIELKK